MRRTLRRGTVVLRALIPATLLLGGAVPAAPAAEDAAQDPDAAVRRRIVDAYRESRGLRMDGRAADWKRLHAEEDPRGDVAVPGLDIVAVAVAPRATDAVVLVHTAGPFASSGGRLRVEFDLHGFSDWDAEVAVPAKGEATLRTFLAGIPRAGESAEGVEVAVGDVIEIRLPLHRGVRGHPESAVRAVLEGVRRPWVRVRATTTDASGTVVDVGPATASFLLAESPGPLDAPPPLDEPHRRAVGFPAGGTWFVRQGGFGLWSHRDLWAYDFSSVDATLEPGRPGATTNREFHAWDRPLHLPEDARVLQAVDDAPDQEPGAARGVTGRSTALQGNHVLLRFADGLRMDLHHLRGGSVTVARGEDREAGSLLGRVGNSGASGVPHLHVSLHERPGEFRGVPMTLRRVRVSLHPGDDDPWARDLEAWEVREGCFVRALTSPAPGR